jgi:FkbM family methyltransferase
MSKEKNGHAILGRGLMELTVTEACFRLARPDTLAVDIGANIGHMTSALAHAMGSGRVRSYEPHPLLFSFLQENGQRLRREVTEITLELCDSAISEKSGDSTLYVSSQWDNNAGVASLQESEEAETVSVNTSRLDDEVGEIVQVLKLDVEGFEGKALKGAEKHIRNKTIRHIIFEDHNVKKQSSSTKTVGVGLQDFCYRKTSFGSPAY